MKLAHSDDYEVAGSGTRLQMSRVVAEGLVVWAIVCASVFLIYELVHAAWLDNAAQSTIDVAHILRGVAASLITTVVAGCYVIRRMSSVARGPDGDDSYGEQSHIAVGSTMWLLGLRWVAVVALAAVLCFVSLVDRWVPSESLPYLWAGVVMLFGVNAALSAVDPQRLSSQAALTAQVASDVLILGWCIHFAGGLTNPCAGFFVFHAVIAGVMLQRPRARRVTAAIAAFVIVQAAIEASGVLPPGCLYDAAGGCLGSDWSSLATSGAAVAMMVVGCGLIVSELVRVMRERGTRLLVSNRRLRARDKAIAVAKTELLRERQTLQSILDCMPDAVLYVAPDASIRVSNRAAQTMWSSWLSEAGGDLLQCHPHDKREQLFDKLSCPDLVEMHPLLSVADRTYEANYARALDDDGRLEGVVMVARDVTERLATQRWKMEQERMSVVGKLAAALAHEINNPLATIALFSRHVLAELPVDDPSAEHLETVIRNADLCGTIVRDLLDYARRRPPERRHVDVDALIGDVLRNLEQRALAAKVALRRDAVSAEPLCAFGDPDQLRQVLVNLGLNGIDATAEGGRLTVSATAVDDTLVRIDVVDTGSGIAPQDQEQIFTAFHTTKAQGTGLGLAVVRDILKAHGARIELQSEVGHGSTFSVLLPSQPVSLKEAS